MFAENVAAFFTDFAVTATWQPSWGGAARTGNVILDTPDILIGAFQQDAISTDYRIRFATSDFLSITENEFISVNGKKYQLHETPRLLSDGAISEVALGKVL